MDTSLDTTQKLKCIEQNRKQQQAETFYSTDDKLILDTRLLNFFVSGVLVSYQYTSYSFRNFTD